VKPHLKENSQHNPTHQKEKKISDFVSLKKIVMVYINLLAILQINSIIVEVR